MSLKVKLESEDEIWLDKDWIARFGIVFIHFLRGTLKIDVE